MADAAFREGGKDLASLVGRGVFEHFQGSKHLQLFRRHDFDARQDFFHAPARFEGRTLIQSSAKPVLDLVAEFFQLAHRLLADLEIGVIQVSDELLHLLEMEGIGRLELALEVGNALFVRARQGPDGLVSADAVGLGQGFPEELHLGRFEA